MEFTASTKNSNTVHTVDIGHYALLSMHVTGYSIILPGQRASIGITHSYSSHPFLCTRIIINMHVVAVLSVYMYMQLQVKVVKDRVLSLPSELLSDVICS